MTTETLIKKLRSFLPSGPLAQETMLEAAARLEELERDLVRLRRVTTRPEPSRLEIAAMAMQGFIQSSGFIIDVPNNALAYADALIAAAKEAK